MGQLGGEQWDINITENHFKPLVICHWPFLGGISIFHLMFISSCLCVCIYCLLIYLYIYFFCHDAVFGSCVFCMWYLLHDSDLIFFIKLTSIWNRNESFSEAFVCFMLVAFCLNPAETPINSASRQDSNNVRLRL